MSPVCIARHGEMENESEQQHTELHNIYDIIRWFVEAYMMAAATEPADCATGCVCVRR